MDEEIVTFGDNEIEKSENFAAIIIHLFLKKR